MGIHGPQGPRIKGWIRGSVKRGQGYDLGKQEGAHMSFRITTNMPSLTAQRYLSLSQKQTENSLSAIASGSRVTSPGNDAAGFAISEVLRGQISGTRTAKQNAIAANSMIQTAEGALNEQNNILIRLRELAVQAASDSIGDEEREYLDNEFQQLTQEFDRIAQSTRYGHKQLLVGSGENFEFQVGANGESEDSISYTMDTNTTASSVGVSGLGIDDKSSARSALNDIDEAVMKVSGARAGLGAIQSRLNHSEEHLAVMEEGLRIARSNIVDTDVAEETAKLTQSQVLQEAGISVLSQANQNASRVVRLLG